jgi:cation:H+ antiporter
MWIFAGGVILLALGGEAALRGGVTLGRGLGLPPVIVGLFALSIGTSSPTFALALLGAATGHPDLTLGVVIGVTLINLLLILGFGALIHPMSSPPKVVLRDGGAMLGASAALALFAFDGRIGRKEGALLVACFLVYAAVAIVTDWRRSADHSIACAEAEKRSTGDSPSVAGGLVVLIVGTICLLLGAHFLTGGLLGLAAAWNVPLAVLASTLVALAVSLRVLAVTWFSAIRGDTQLTVGHLVTASVFNIFGALGAAALVHPLKIPADFAHADIFMLLAASVVLVPLLMATWRLSRPKGALLLLCYIAYVGFLAWREGLVPHGLPGLA